MTAECSLLVLDELLGVVDHGVVSIEEVKALLAAKTDDTQLIITGRALPEGLRECADEIYQIQVEKGYSEAKS